jgi:hypothetical protein
MAGKLTAAKAAVETSILLKLLLIFIASAPNFRIVMREPDRLFKVRRGGCGKRISFANGYRRSYPLPIDANLAWTCLDCAMRIRQTGSQLFGFG